MNDDFFVNFCGRLLLVYISMLTFIPSLMASDLNEETSTLREPGTPNLPIQLYCPADFSRVDVWSGFVSKSALVQGVYNAYEAYRLAQQHAEDKVARATIHTIHNCESLRRRHKFLISKSKFLNPGSVREACRYHPKSLWSCAVRVSVEVACCSQLQ